MNEISIRVVGIPAPQGSKTLTRYGAMIEASKKVKPWRNDVKEAALQCYNSGALNLPVKADIEFIFPRPKSHFGTGKNAEVLKPSAPKYCTSRGNGDIDKLARSTLDGLSVSAGGSVLEDDCLVVELNTKKRYVKKNELPGSYIAISCIYD
jgi:crossover junction endodeoxyribonuclease RusA